MFALTWAAKFREKVEAWDGMIEVHNVEKPKWVCVEKKGRG